MFTEKTRSNARTCYIYTDLHICTHNLFQFVPAILSLQFCWMTIELGCAFMLFVHVCSKLIPVHIASYRIILHCNVLWTKLIENEKKCCFIYGQTVNASKKNNTDAESQFVIQNGKEERVRYVQTHTSNEKREREQVEKRERNREKERCTHQPAVNSNTNETIS